jgi:D-3-phosphoglycerate dehydrogenase / 2-oxoglutarate reductase
MATDDKTNWCIVNSLDISGAPEARQILESAGTLHNVSPTREAVLPLLGNCRAYMAAGEVQIDEEFINLAPELRVIGSPHTGQDHMDLDLIRQKGIELYTITEEYELIRQFSATSELAFGILLSLVRKISPAGNDALNGIWAGEKYQGFQLLNKTFGILGLGRLGTISAQIAQGFGMKVIAFDTSPRNVSGVENVDFNTLLKESDVLSIHLHLNSETEHMINASAFSLMRDNAILVNTSRGRIIDEVSMLDALLNKKIAGAALDIVDGEWLSQDELRQHPLIRYANKHNNLLITPHIGGSTTESIYGARIFMADRLARYLASSDTNR